MTVATKRVRLFRNPDPELGRGIAVPIDGELFDADDAKRLVGSGGYVTTRPSRSPATPKPTKAPAPAREV